MEWLLLLLFVLAAAALIGLPWRRASDPQALQLELDAMVEERERLLAELRELDRDLESGRLSPGDRADGRRALAPRLREVTEALSTLGVLDEAGPSESG